MRNFKQTLVVLTALMLVFAGASGALAGHRPGHQEPPSCDPHPTKPGNQNKHCQTTTTTTTPPTTTPPTTTPPTTTPPTTTPPVTSTGGGTPTQVAGGGGGAGNRGGGGGAPVAEAPPAVVSDELPFTGLDLPQAVFAAAVLFLLGSASLALGRRRAYRVR